VADSRQGVAYLRRLDRELALVGEHLPRCPGVRRARLDPLGARLDELGRARLGVGALALCDPSPNAVAGNGPRDEDDVPVEARDPRPTEGERVDDELEFIAALGTGAGAGGAQVSFDSTAESTVLRLALRRS
jgi:hypothetical protein